MTKTLKDQRDAFVRDYETPDRECYKTGKGLDAKRGFDFCHALMLKERKKKTSDNCMCIFRFRNG